MRYNYSLVFDFPMEKKERAEEFYKIVDDLLHKHSYDSVDKELFVTISGVIIIIVRFNDWYLDVTNIKEQYRWILTGSYS